MINPEKGRDETVRMIDVVSTNKTDFFRESGHFDVLKNEVLPELCSRKGGKDLCHVNIWSAGCSSGEEPYTIAMVCADYFGEGFEKRFMVHATDISTRVLDVAMKGIYGSNVVDPIPDNFKKKYLLQGKKEREGLYRVVPEIRGQIKFDRLNLMDNEFNGIKKIDIIFCRNVIIYFDRKTQAGLFDRFYRILPSGGYLFIGHSETLISGGGLYEVIAPTVYRKK